MASCIIWFYAFLVSRGVKEAAGVNLIITISKFVPIFVALTAIIFFQKFDVNIFMENMAHGSVEGMSFFEQVSGTMMVTIWVFLGIEGAVAISGRAKKDSDVGKATVIAFVCVLTIYLLVSTLSMGVMPLSELSELSNPALAGVMERAVGPWGATLINGGVVLSLVGAMLGYTVLSAECPLRGGGPGRFREGVRPCEQKGAPIVTLVVTNLIIEVFLVIMLFSESTYQFFYTLSAGMILLPYLLSAAYFAKVAFTEAGSFKGQAGRSPCPFGACSPSSASSIACSLRGQAAPSALHLCLSCMLLASCYISRARRSVASRSWITRSIAWWPPSSSSRPSCRSACWSRGTVSI